MRDRDEKITLKDCKEQLTDWARELVDKEIRRRPEGLKLKQLEELNDTLLIQLWKAEHLKIY